MLLEKLRKLLEPTSLSPEIKAQIKGKSLLASTGRNGGIGFLIGSIFLVMKLNKSRKSKEEWEQFKQDWISYVFKWPLFLTVFTVSHKILSMIGRSLVGYHGVRSDGSRNVARRLVKAFWAFLCGYLAQIVSPVFNWNWALYIMLRSWLGLCRLLIPIDLQPQSVHLYTLVHAALPYFITYNVMNVSSSYLSFFKAVLDEQRERWRNMYGHNHGILPPCHRHTHVSKHKSCLKTQFYDFVYNFKVCYTFYIKFYLLTSLLGGLVFIKSLLRKPQIVIPRLLKQSLYSCLFLLIAFQFPSRIHCLYQWILRKYHRSYRNDKYAPIAANNLWLMLGISAVFGNLCLRFEKSVTKRTDIALFTCWRIVECWFRALANLDTYDKDHDHPILGSQHLPAVFLGVASAANFFVFFSDKKALKSLEGRVLNYGLA